MEEEEDGGEETEEVSAFYTKHRGSEASNADLGSLLRFMSASRMSEGTHM